MPRGTEPDSTTRHAIADRASVHSNAPLPRGTPVKRLVLVALTLALGLLLASLIPAGIPAQLAGHASAHALLVRSSPSADAIESAPPSVVRMWFTEDLNPLTSHAVVVDTTNHEVDKKDSRVSSSDQREMVVGLHLLPAGTYVVVWRTQSAVDGHITGGSFIFRVARPDGTVPPVPSVLPTGHVPGAAGTGVSGSSQMDGPTLLQSVSTWLALVFLAFWAGGVIWETWILGPGSSADADLEATALATARRFRSMAPYALGGIIVADIGIVLGQSAELAGDWSGVISGTLLRAVLFGSEFGTFWWMRELCALVALGLTLVASHYGWRRTRSRAPLLTSEDPAASPQTAPIPDSRRAILHTLRSVPHLPRRLILGVRRRSALGRAELLLAAALILAFALSGHAAAVPRDEFAYALSVDLVHLLANAVWVGGLFYISAVLVPALGTMPPTQRYRVLAKGLPEFSAIAIVSAILLAATGSLNTSIHLTSIRQFVTTTYGIVLAVKIELFLIMVAISAYHAFHVRPRLTAALGAARMAPPSLSPETSRTGAALAELALTAPGRSAKRPEGSAEDSAGDRQGTPEHDAGTSETDGKASSAAARLAGQIEKWLRREAILGVGVLLCVALLAAFAGTLSPTVAGSGTGGSSGPFNQTQVISGYHIALNVTPARFGTNTFTVVLTDSHGKPVQGASVLLQTHMLDMDMGTQSTQLKATGAAGTYSGKSDVTMAGHWEATCKILPPGSKQFVNVNFHFSASS